MGVAVFLCAHFWLDDSANTASTYAALMLVCFLCTLITNDSSRNENTHLHITHSFVYLVCMYFFIRLTPFRSVSMYAKTKTVCGCTRKNKIFSTKENERMGEQKRPKKCVAFNYFSQFYLVIFVLFSFEIKRCLKIVVYYTQFNCFFAHRSSRLPQFFRILSFFHLSPSFCLPPSPLFLWTDMIQCAYLLALISENERSFVNEWLITFTLNFFLICGERGRWSTTHWYWNVLAN